MSNNRPPKKEGPPPPPLSSKEGKTTAVAALENPSNRKPPAAASLPFRPSSTTSTPTNSTHKKSSSPTATTTTTTPSNSRYKTASATCPPAMNTIHSVASQDDSLPLPPPHPMFQKLHEDSDGSDGSIVFANRQKNTTERDRFPSFDSMASSGSVVRKGSNNSNNNVPSPPVPKTSSPQTAVKSNTPQLLPYAERRKLKKLKQQKEQAQRQPQQKQQQQQRPRRSSPPPPDGRFVPYMMPPDFPQQQQHPYMMNGMPMPGPPSSRQYMPFPMQQHVPPHHNNMQHLPPHVQVPFVPYPPPPNARLSPYRAPPQQQQQQQRMNPRLQQKQQYQEQHHGKNRPYLPQQQQQQQQITRPLSSSRQSTGDSSSSKNIKNNNNRYMQPDFSDPEVGNALPPPPLLTRKNNIATESAASGQPPPPPPPPPHHVRAESTGSVSSLGSQSSNFGYYASNGANSDVDRQPKSSSFLQRLNPFSPKIPKSPQQSRSDFHTQNQAFLNKMTGEKATRQASPVQGRHQRVASEGRPPASRWTHERLDSIGDDDWEEERGAHRDYGGIERVSSSDHSSSRRSGGRESPSSHFSTSEGTDDDEAFRLRSSNNNDNIEEAHEQTSLLPPPGQGSSEYPENNRGSRYSESHPSNRRRQKERSSRRSKRSPKDSRQRSPKESRGQRDRDVQWSANPGVPGLVDDTYQSKPRGSRRKAKKEHKKRRRRRRNQQNTLSGASDSDDKGGGHSSSSSSYDYRRWTRRRAQMLENERARLIAHWKAEARAETSTSRASTREHSSWPGRIRRILDDEFGGIATKTVNFLISLEAFICNLPLTVGAIAMAIVTLGVVWFKFVEEYLDSCEPVQFHSSQCTFPEFPGCFYCDTTAPMYKVAVTFHFACSALAGVLALSFVLKLLLATQVVLDEMSSPTTASPAGLICMTIACVFAGRGILGQILVSLASCVHLCLVIWFIYMALAYHIMPDPSWFPNTVGIGMSAVKTWLYYPMSGHFLMAISLSLSFFFFPISLIRVVMNEKISATVAYMQMSAPAISLYALTIMAQPSFEEEKPDINRFQRAHRQIYLPGMHFLFAMSVIGMLASVQSLFVRWNGFKKREFSPAHAAFCFPTLLHANSIQAYRDAINSFSKIPAGSPWRTALDVYWLFVLAGGTLVTLWVAAKFVCNLPSWTDISVEGEEEPPAPYETTMTLQNMIATGESLVQPFVSPAVLQANETGALVMVRRGRDGARNRFVRTRKFASLGFEPIMTWSEMEHERELLLEYVGKNPPRQRDRNQSVPGIDFSSGPDIGVGNTGIYGVEYGPEQEHGFTPGRGGGKAELKSLF